MIESVKVAVGMVRRELAALNFATMDGQGATEAVGVFGELRKLAESGLTLAAARVEATDRTALAGTGFSDAKDLLSSAAGMSRGAAEGLLDLAERLEGHTATKDAFLGGLLSAAEAAEVAKAADRNAAAEPDLLNTARDKKKNFKDLRNQAAAVSDPDPAADPRRAAYARAKRGVRSWCDSDGLGHLHIQGGPEAVAALWSRINGAADVRFKSASAAGVRSEARHNLFDGLYDLVMGSAVAGPAKAKVDLTIVVDWEALRRGVVGEGERCEIPGVGPVSVEVARSYLGEAALKFLVSDGVSIATVAHLGRHRGAHLRSALATMFSSCIDCGRGLGLEWDHVEPSAKGGPTSFDNLRPRCKACHRAKTATVDFPEGTSGYRRRAEAIAGRGARPGAAKGSNSAAGTRPKGGTDRAGAAGPDKTGARVAAGTTRRRT